MRVENYAHETYTSNRTGCAPDAHRTRELADGLLLRLAELRRDLLDRHCSCRCHLPCHTHPWLLARILARPRAR